MKTIVEYSAAKPPKNAYPRRIVSPPHASPCCFSHMGEVGEVQEENGWRFIYKRCAVCGFTVRYFGSVTPDLLPVWRVKDRWLFQHKGLSRKPNKGGKRLTVNVR